MWITFGSVHEVRAFRERKKRSLWFRGLVENCVVVNIRTAKVTKDTGILTIEMDGDAEEIERAVKFIEEKGVLVQPIEGQIFTE